ncbi:MAG TPA: amidohydrolase family protein [Longimicrobiales bacterium]|nr:amidohydrolase family protein [Longimicrobiales bacterium]
MIRTTRYRADWVLPVAAPPIRDGAVLVDDYGVIQDVGPNAAVPRPDSADDADLGAAIILPGLVNVHTHPELAGMRGLLEDLPFHQWIPALRSAKEAAALSADDFGDSARWACLEAAAAGITAIGATEDSGAALEAMRETGLRGIVYREVFGPAPAQAEPAMARLRERVDAMRRRTTDLVGVGISPHAPYTVSDELFALAAGYAADEGLPVAVHAAEAEVEAQLVTAGAGPFAAGLRTRGIPTPPRGRSTIDLLHRTGVLRTRPLLIHCVFVDADDIRRMADAGAAVAHCPIANARLGQGIAPVIELLEAGVRVGLGTDSVASGNRVDLLEEARSAQLMQRARLASAFALPPDRLLRLATIDGARALGLDRRVGTLEVGKDADLCAVRIDRPHTRPVIDPVATLFMSARGPDVVLTTVRGKVLYRDGAFATLQPSSLRRRIDAIGERLLGARDGGTATAERAAPGGAP